MANKVTGYPEEHPYNKVVVEIGCHFIGFIKRPDGSIIEASAVSYGTGSPVPSLIKSQARRQAIKVFKKSEEIAKKKNKPT